MHEQIENKIKQALKPQHIEVIDESSKHNVPSGSESHFKVIVVSDTFTNCALIDRHRTMNAILAEELASSVHALSLHTLSPDEWEQSEHKIKDSPPCLN